MVFLMSYRLEDFEWQHNNELPTSLRMILRLVPLVIPAFTQYARTFSPPQRVCRILPSLKCGWIWLSKSVVAFSRKGKV
eukprot:XP_019077063.1 PREDICTED: uncharacterized protein LOC109122984 isoform X4 [Vitis vinifera]